MSLLELIDSDLKTAMKSSDKVAVSTLRIVKSVIKNREIEKGAGLSDEEIVSTLTTLSKQRRESIEQFEKGGRADLVSAEKAELAVLRKYLPEQLPEEKLDELIREAIKETAASGRNDIGKVMKEVMPKIQGRADGKKVNQMVARLLSS
jgi:uncharacterized protein YqeY